MYRRCPLHREQILELKSRSVRTSIPVACQEVLTAIVLRYDRLRREANGEAKREDSPRNLEECPDVIKVGHKVVVEPDKGEDNRRGVECAANGRKFIYRSADSDGLATYNRNATFVGASRHIHIAIFAAE